MIITSKNDISINHSLNTCHILEKDVSSMIRNESFQQSLAMMISPLSELKNINTCPVHRTAKF